VKFLEKIESVSATEAKSLLRQRFLKNLEFFKQKEQKLYEKLSQKPSMFGLVVDECGVNILNLASNTLVYPTGADGRYVAVKSSVESAKNPLSHTKWKIGFEQNPFYMASSNLVFTGAACKEMFGYAYINGMNPGEIDLPRAYLPFASIYGIGGGFVLEAMNEEYEGFEALFVYEPFVDFFGISAHLVDYEALFAKCKELFLGVGEPPTPSEIRVFFLRHRYAALYPRLELTLFDAPQIESVKNSVRLESATLLRGIGSYEDEMIGWRNSQKNCPYSNLKYPVYTGARDRVDFPIFVVGNGASLDDFAWFLSKNQERMVIFSAGTALKTLLKHGIRPDFQIEIERTDYLGGILREVGVDDIDMIAANVVDPDTLSATRGERYLFFRDYTASSYINSPKFLIKNSSPFVGNAAFSLALSMSKNIYLCGIDVGYKKGRTVHSKDSIYNETNELPEGSVRVVANFEESEIYSNQLYNLSRNVLEFAIYDNKECNVYNISDGAMIIGAKPCREPMLAVLDKQNAILEIKSMFSNVSEEVFEKNGMADIEKEIEVFKKELLSVLLLRIVDKRGFFVILRLFDEFARKKESQNDVLFFLFGGSLRHMLFSMYVAILHTKTENFGEFYLKIVEIFIKGFESLVADFKKESAKGRISGLLGGIKAL
jgi:hypothetical protein